MFGVFCGFLIVCMLVVVVLQYENSYSINTDPELKVVFPIFRAPLLLTLYFWLLSWNTYGWNKYNINYKLVFQFNEHYSLVNQQLKRCAFFTFLWVVSYMWFITDKSMAVSIVDIDNNQYIPLCLWVVLLGYLFFPSTRMFNGQGRLYILRQLKNILFFFIYPCTFVHKFISDQFVSFVAIIKDFTYSACYYQHSFNTDLLEKISISNQCNSAEKLYVGFMAAAIPYLFRLIQCTKTMYQDKSLGVEIFNFVKYFLSFLVALFSFLHYYVDEK